MNKNEKTIKGLEQFIADFKPFIGNKSDWQQVDDALELLKALDVTPEELERLKAQEQEPLAPIERSAPAQGANDVWYECRNCGKFLDINPCSIQVCPKCGRKVKW